MASAGKARRMPNLDNKWRLEIRGHLHAPTTLPIQQQSRMDHSRPRCWLKRKIFCPYRKFTPDPSFRPVAVKTAVSRVIRDHDLPGTYNFLGHYRKRQEIVMIYIAKSSRYSDWLRAGRSGDRIPVGARFSAPVQTCPGAHPASCTMDTGSLPEVKSGRGVTLTPHPF